MAESCAVNSVASKFDIIDEALCLICIIVLRIN